MAILHSVDKNYFVNNSNFIKYFLSSTRMNTQDPKPFKKALSGIYPLSGQNWKHNKYVKVFKNSLSGIPLLN